MGEKDETWLPLKLLKLAALLSLAGVTLWQCVLNFKEYYQFDVVTSVSKEEANWIEFPQVTVCNYNRWKMSLLPPVAYEMAVAAYAKANGQDTGTNSSTSGNSIDIYNFTYQNGWQLIDANNAAQFPNRSITLGLCSFAGKACSTKFFKHRMTSYGNCYTFNQDLTEEGLSGSGASASTIALPLKQAHASETNGLELYIDIEAWDYAEIPQTSGNPLLGLKVIIHSKDDEPDPTASGVSVGPGFYGTISVKRTEYNNVIPPWGVCNPDAKTKYFGTYTLSTCETECKMNLVESNCSCRPYYYPLTTNMCNLDDTLGCAAKVIGNINSNFSNYCTCPEPCTYEEYAPTVSYASFPSTAFGSQIVALSGIPSIDYMKQNYVGLRIYFSDMGSTIITQSPALTWLSTLTNVGGTSGLYVGFSCLTIVQLATVIVELAYARIKKKTNSTSPIPSTASKVQKVELQ